MKKIILVLGFLVTLFVGSDIVKASESGIIEQSDVAIALDQKQNSDIRVTSELLELPLTRNFSGLNATIWMVVRDNTGVPALDKYWYVTYKGGRKYQGYVYWTGNRKIDTIVPSIKWNFQFSGYLSPA